MNTLDVFLATTNPDRQEAYVAALRSPIEAGTVMWKDTDAGLAITRSPQQAS